MTENSVGLFIGTRRGYSVLSALISRRIKISCVLVLSQQRHEFDNATDDIINLCTKNKIPYQTTKEIKPDRYKEFLKKYSPSLVFVISWRFLISKDCFHIPPLGVFILHDSLLPKYRGASPTNWVIINGEKKTGLTLQYISEGVDSGDVVDQIKIPLKKDETAKSLNDTFIKLYPTIIIRNIDAIFKKKNNKIPQNSRVATYACRRSPEDGKIDFNQPAKNIERLVRGLAFPYPGAFCHYQNKKIIIWKASLLRNPPQYVGVVYGKVVAITNGYIDVLVLDGILRIEEIATEDKPTEMLKPNQIIKSISFKLE